MAPHLRISAKNLGSLALPGFCPRCFWIKTQVENKLPYQIFPGIFSSLDSYGKRLVHGWFDRHNTAPPWLAALGSITGYRNPPHFSKFRVLLEDVSVLVTGTPDGILVRSNDSHLIIDYKTAKFTETQDELLPMYDAQLNTYAFIGERCGFSPVSGLALVYTEPITSDDATNDDRLMTEDGFVLGFSAKILPVDLKPDVVPRLAQQARQVFDLDRPPDPAADCKECSLLENLISIATR